MNTMLVHHHHWHGPLRFVVALSLALACVEAQAQGVHEQREGEYLLRVSTVASEHLSAEAARANGIEPSRTRAVLNVLVLHGDKTPPNPVRAAVRASIVDLGGNSRPIEMREVTAGEGGISYIGAYTFAPREVLDYNIVAEPEGSSRQISLSYRERMWLP